MRTLSAILFVIGCLLSAWGFWQILVYPELFPWLGMIGFLVLASALWTLLEANSQNPPS
ncbi:MAG: hypothetical protein Q8P76_01290 [bacterium]|nr:hypothetical protein [bacterium]